MTSPPPHGTRGSGLRAHVLDVLAAALTAVTVAMTVLTGSAAPAGAMLAPVAAPAPAAPVSDPAALVNPFIGTANSGHTFPGADVPFGMVQWSPDTTSRPAGGGYSYSDSSITGFSLTHLSGAGCAAEGDIPVLPTVGTVPLDAGSVTDSFSHSRESASAGFYSVLLTSGTATPQPISARLTATTRTGMADLTFPKTTQANLILKLNDSQKGNSATSFTVVSGTQVTGSATSGGFCKTADTSYTLYFDMQFSQPFTSSGRYTTTAVPSQQEGAYLTFDTRKDQTLLVKVGISYVSAANATANLAAENPGWNFAATRAAAVSAWNALLDKVEISGGTAAQRQVFYTAVYHSLLYPSVFSDDNGQYIGVDGHLHSVDAGHAYYTNISGWDTYRGQAQLEALLDPSAASDTAQSMLDDYTQDGMLPRWMEDNTETFIMAGDPADALLADYYAFGADGFNARAALADMVAQATQANDIRPGGNYLNAPGYLPVNGSYGCCNYYAPASTTLEYDTDDFAISALAGRLGDTSIQREFARRAQDWRNVLDTDSGFAQPRAADGLPTRGFTPASRRQFAEGDSWIYTGMVPFDLAGLAAAKGGNGQLADYLDQALSSYKGAHGYAYLGNENSFELPWEYDYAREPYRTQHALRQIEDGLWTDSPGGLGDGNDDLGALSAWYVWAALGMYPMTPGTTDLALGSPLFRRAVLTLPSGATLTIKGNGASPAAAYVRSATWDSATWSDAYAPATAVSRGGTLSFTLGRAPDKSWAAAASDAPPSYSGGVAAPPLPRVGAIRSGPSAGLCATASTAKGTPVYVAACDDASAAQQWTVAPDRTVRALGMCLTVYRGRTERGTAVEVNDCDGGRAQQWTVGPHGSLVNPRYRLCLTDPHSSPSPGTDLRIWSCDGASDQAWTLPRNPPG